MAEKLATATGRSVYARRKHLVEAVNGWIKHILGFRQFSLRGLSAVQGEWDLVCLSLNLRRMSSLDRKSTRLNSSHVRISYAVFCLKKKKSKLDLSSAALN